MAEKVEHDGAVVTGAGLAAYCPSCREALTMLDRDGGEVLVHLRVRRGEKDGDLFLAPSAEGGRRTSTLDLGEDDAVDAVLCPHCGASLVDGQRRCAACGGPRARVLVAGVKQPRLSAFCVTGGNVNALVEGAAGARPARSRPRRSDRPPREERHRMPEQDAVLRARNFSEVTYGFDRELAMAEAARCLSCKKPKCIDGCPVNVDIPAFIAQIKEGDFLLAARTIKQKNSLPAICGRVCPQDQQCEEVCVLAKKEGAVAIGALERFVADFERGTDAVTLPERAPRTGHRVAVVGSGPAGLTLAADLVLLGHGVTVFEALHKPGGVLAYGIPEFRLPKDVVEAEIAYLRRLGVKFEIDAVVGRLFDLEDLFAEGYDAVYLATGAGLPIFLGLPGENLCNVVSANEYLTRVNLMKAYLFPDYDTPAPKGTRVAVLGGGNVAMDCARTALRMGSREVTVVYRRTRDEMPARSEEIVHAEQEGVHFRYLTSPVRYIGDEQGWVRQLECVPMKLGQPDASGRPRPIPVTGASFLLDVDMVLVAIGAGPNPTLFAGCAGLERSERGYIRTFSDAGRTSLPRVWAGGDIVTGSATVILAMGAARMAAADIHAYVSDGATDWPAPAGSAA
ncbi:MAG TPA: NADPH-dependent glutamate synthase [Thermoleophilia bacterium]|nr:NADPH-dependent glutamate synthase [Thermoleophilia bacterium]